MAPMMDIDQTIAAIASPAGDSLRGIVRVSGPATAAILGQLMPGVDWASVGRNRLVRGRLAPEALAGIEAMVLYWPDERSYTRQPSAEIHVPGSRTLLDWIMDLACDAGARLARPGEFTMRAFLAGRIDLTQAEAVLGLIDATEESQLKVALRQMAGGLSTPLDELRDALIHVLAELEAGLDFVEEDIEFISVDELVARLSQVEARIDRIRRQIAERDLASDETVVLLEGLPNAGKSSLFNALAGGQAIVSNIPGTTRDYIQANLQWNGVSIRLVDTAGWDEGLEELTEKVRQATAEIQGRADVRILCLDASRTEFTEYELARMQADEPGLVIAWTKSDLRLPERPTSAPSVATSAVTGQGLDPLRSIVLEMAAGDPNREMPVLLATAARARTSLAAAAEHVREAVSLASTQSGDELVAAEVRLALAELGTVVGTVYTDDILDVVFGQFCIGK